MKILGVDFTESLYQVASDTSTRILIVLNLYCEDYGWIAELCDAEAAFLHPNMEVEIYIECIEGIVYLGIISKEFLKEYYILLGKLIYGKVDSALLWLRMMEQYLVNECNVKRSKADSCIFFRKYEKRKLELVMPVHVNNVFMAGKPETLKGIKEKIKEKFNISDSGEVKTFLGVYYK